MRKVFVLGTWLLWLGLSKVFFLTLVTFLGVSQKASLSEISDFYTKYFLAYAASSQALFLYFLYLISGKKQLFFSIQTGWHLKKFFFPFFLRGIFFVTILFIMLLFRKHTLYTGNFLSMLDPHFFFWEWVCFSISFLFWMLTSLYLFLSYWNPKCTTLWRKALTVLVMSGIWTFALKINFFLPSFSWHVFFLFFLILYLLETLGIHWLSIAGFCTGFFWISETIFQLNFFPHPGPSLFFFQTLPKVWSLSEVSFIIGIFLLLWIPKRWIIQKLFFPIEKEV